MVPWLTPSCAPCFAGFRTPSKSWSNGPTTTQLPQFATNSLRATGEPIFSKCLPRNCLYVLLRPARIGDALVHGNVGRIATSTLCSVHSSVIHFQYPWSQRSLSRNIRIKNDTSETRKTLPWPPCHRIKPGQTCNSTASKPCQTTAIPQASNLPFHALPCFTFTKVPPLSASLLSESARALSSCPAEIAPHPVEGSGESTRARHGDLGRTPSTARTNHETFRRT